MASDEGTSANAAILDACVLYPAALRDTLLRAAQAGLYIPHWSDTIIDEFVRNLIADGRITEQGAERLRDALRTAFPEAAVTGHEVLSAVGLLAPKFADRMRHLIRHYT